METRRERAKSENVMSFRHSSVITTNLGEGMPNLNDCVETEQADLLHTVVFLDACNDLLSGKLFKSNDMLDSRHIQEDRTVRIPSQPRRRVDCPVELFRGLRKEISSKNRQVESHSLWFTYLHTIRFDVFCPALFPLG